MTNTLFFSKQLDDSNGSIKVNHNNAMQLASQTTELPATAKKRLGLLAILAVGVDAAASFLKSKMEKAAAVASQVGAAVLKSKKAVFSAADAVLGAVQIQPPMIAEKRLASIPLFTLLVVFFLASPNGMAVPRGVWLPAYEEHYYNKLRKIAVDIPVVGQIPVPNVEPWSHKTSLWSTYYPPINIPTTFTYFVGSVTEATYSLLGWRRDSYKTTTHISGGLKLTSRTYRNAAGKQVTVAEPNHLNLVYHQKVGDKTSIWISGWANSLKNKTIEKWKNKVYFRKTHRMSGGPFSFRVHFEVENLSLSRDDDNYLTSCEGGVILAYPGSATSVSPCVPSNMSMPSNDCLRYAHSTQYVPPPVRDEDNE